MRAISIAIFLAAFACSERRPAPTETASTTDGLTKAQTDKASVAPAAPGAQRVAGAFQPQVADRFYPGDSAVLRKLVQGFIDNGVSAAGLAERDIVGILAPHAGYEYSGPVAGSAYKAVVGRPYKTVVVMAISHHRGADRAALLDTVAYDTPLGSALIDHDAVETLATSHGEVFEVAREMFRDEHSLEVQLPFVQLALPGAHIVPIIVAVHDVETIGKIGAALFDVFGKRSDVLFVVSSDLSHFFPYERAKGYDEKNLSLLEKWKLDDWLVQASRSTEGMCGVMPTLAFARLFDRYDAARRRVTRIDYRNSGDTTGDKSRVVGYGALAFSVEKNMRTEQKKRKDFGPYTAPLRRELMSLAKASVTAAAKGERYTPSEPAEPELKEKGAAFVTLKKAGDLRGCIGHVIARMPLWQCVNEVAHAAAVEDYRFSPVRQEELPELTFEISVLTTPKPISPSEVVVGKHGLIMSQGGRSGLLLPQVPIEWGWDRDTFLEHTCRKAGLPPGCWKDSATHIESFEAIVFGEDELVE